MKKSIITLLLIIPFMALSQDKEDTYNYNNQEYTIHEDGTDSYFITEQDTIYIFTEKMPEFPGGQSQLFKYIGEKLKYPAEAKANNIQGKVYTSFLVTKKGEITNITLLKRVNELLDKEALRVVNLFPNGWTPGSVNGNPVNVVFVLPLSFTLL